MDALVDLGDEVLENEESETQVRQYFEMISEVTKHVPYQQLMTDISHADELIGVSQIATNEEDFINLKSSQIKLLELSRLMELKNQEIGKTGRSHRSVYQLF